MRLRIFFVISIIIHVLFFTFLYFIPRAEEKKKQVFSANLVTPEEVSRPAQPMPVPKPMPRQVPLPAPFSKRRPGRTPVPPSKLFPPTARIQPEGPPVVPGTGSDSGRSLPDGIIQPGKGKAGPPGDDADTKPGIEAARPGPSARAKLFDRGEIAAVARKDSSVKRQQDGITFETRDYRFAGYMNKLKSKIESIWVYPPEALAKGVYGDLKLRFTINKDGSIAKVELDRTSGYKMLDDAAIRAIKEGEPYWPLPEDWGMETYTILGHFIYGLHGYQLR